MRQFLPLRDKRDAELTVGLCRLSAARAPKDHDAFAILNGESGVVVILFLCQTRQTRQANQGQLTVYWQKANGMLLQSRRILIQTVPYWLNALVTSTSSLTSSSDSGRLLN